MRTDKSFCGDLANLSASARRS